MADPAACRSCSWYERCGGLAQTPGSEQQGLWGCFEACTTECQNGECDWTCPHNRALWLRRWSEVGGIHQATVAPLHAVAPAQLPLYLPVVRHGKRRRRPLNAQTVALSLYEVVGQRRDGRYGAITGRAATLRRRFRLRSDCRVLLVSVGPDELLERFWRHYRAADIVEVLAGLDLVGVTAPNFSFFDDAPRTHSLWNRRRMVWVAEQLSAAGVPVIPHLNASNARDWDYWAGFLREHRNVDCVAKEFQTGLKHRQRGLPAFLALAELQQQIGRTLHPVLIGGARYLPMLGSHFAGHGTVVDSRPFMNTVKRRIADPSGADGKLRWRPFPSLPGRNLDALLDHNLATYRVWAHRQGGCLANTERVL